VITFLLENFIFTFKLTTQQLPKASLFEQFYEEHCFLLMPFKFSPTPLKYPHPNIKVGVNTKAVFWLGIMVLMQIARSHFRQSKISLLIPHICGLGCFINF